MAKLFPIGIEVEEVAVGSVLRILNKTPGVAKLHLNLLNESPPTEDAEAVVPNEVRQTLPPVKASKPGSSQMVVAEVLKVTPAHNNILGEALKRNGYSPMSLASLLIKMRERSFIKRVGVGTWRITDKGLRHYFNNISANSGEVRPRLKNANPKGFVTDNRSGVRGLVLAALSNGSQVLAKDLRKILEENQYSPKNMTGTVGKMRGEGLVESNGGVYTITERGRASYNEVMAKPLENSVEN